MVDSAFVRSWVEEIARSIEEQRDFLTQLDAAIGDADHGVNMQRGFTAAVATVQSSSDRSPGSLLEEVGKTLIYRVGGAAGPLYGTGFRQIGVTISEAVTRSARLRTESRGAHSRLDFPDTDDKRWGKVNCVVSRAADGAMDVRTAPLPKMPKELRALLDTH